MAQDCKLKPQDDGTFACTECGEIYPKLMRVNCLIKNRVRHIVENPMPCVHRGAEVRKATAKKCCGATFELPVHACALHGECTLMPYNPVEGQAVPRACVSCPDISMQSEKPCQLERFKNFSRALAGHVASGAKRVSLEVIQERWSKCESCPLNKNNICTHADCGCNIAPIDTFLNKLAWADQKCPLNPPLWEAVE